MSNHLNDGGPAFPHKRQIRCNGEVIDSEMEHGMSLRDYFAAAALQGLLAYDGDCSTAIGLAYHTSDAMLEWRKKNP